MKGGVPMNGILFAPGPGSARGWPGRVPGPSRRPGPPGAGPARKSSHSVRVFGLAPEVITELRRTSPNHLFYNVFGHLAQVEIPMRLRLARSRNFHVSFGGNGKGTSKACILTYEKPSANVAVSTCAHFGEVRNLLLEFSILSEPILTN